MAEDDYDLYDALNLQRDASCEDVRAAFRELSRVYHPDKHRTSSSGAAGGNAGAEDAFRRVHRAYRVLSDDVLRGFYDRYGLHGVRLAETLSDDEGEGDGGAGRLCLPEDRLQDLERRVQRLVRRHEELRAQRLLALQGSFALALLASPGPHGAHLRRRYRLQYTATSHSVQIALSEGVKVMVGCASHVQGSNGVGVAKLMLGATSALGASTAGRASLNVTGSHPEVDVSVTRSLSPHCTVQQKLTCSADGGSMSLNVYPWLTRTIRGSLGCTCGGEPSVSVGLLRKEPGAPGARAQLTLQPGAGELSVQMKYKPARGFSLRLAPSLSHEGWAVQATCKQAFDGGLTKLYWALRVRRRGLSVRLTLRRSGLSFSLPVELWSEGLGPMPLAELGLAVALWAAPPLGLRLLRSAGRALWAAASAAAPRAADDAARPAEGAARAAASSAGEVASTATEQRRLVEREAARRRDEEVAQRGLEILVARYGARHSVLQPGAATDGVIDVTECLMAKVRRSQLHVSDAPKSSLLGFGDASIAGTAAADLALYIRYRFGGIEYERTFGETEPVLLP